MEKAKDYLRQAVVVRKDLNMPNGKAMAMVCHGHMAPIHNKMRPGMYPGPAPGGEHHLHFSDDEARWMTEMDPGLEDLGQVSAATIIMQVKSESKLLEVARKAEEAGLQCHKIYDCGYSHNKARTLVCISIGPTWKEKIQPVTGDLDLYR